MAVSWRGSGGGAEDDTAAAVPCSIHGQMESAPPRLSAWPGSVRSGGGHAPGGTSSPRACAGRTDSGCAGGMSRTRPSPDGLAHTPGPGGASEARRPTDAGAGSRGHRSHAAHPPACPRGLGVSGRAARAVEHAGEARRAYGHHVYPAAFGRPLWGGRARVGQPGRGVRGGVQHAGARVWPGGLGAGVGGSPTRACPPCSGGAVDQSRLHEPRDGGRDADPSGRAGTGAGHQRGRAAVTDRHLCGGRCAP